MWSPLFEEAYPQYDLEALNMGAQEILERVRGEQANPQADFLWGGTEAAFKMAAQERLLEAYVPSFAETSRISTRIQMTSGTERFCCRK